MLNRLARIEALEDRVLLSVAPLTAEHPAAAAVFVGDAGLKSARFDFHFPDAPQLTGPDGAASLSMAGEQAWDGPGQPTLPVHPATILLPPGMQISSVQVDYPEAGSVLGTGVRLAVAADVGAAGGTLDSGAPAEAEPASLGGVTFSNGTYLGYDIGSLAVFPVEYGETAGTVTFHPDVAVTVIATPDDPVGKLPVRHLAADRQQVADLVLNPELLGAYDGSAEALSPSDPSAGGRLNPRRFRPTTST